MQHLIEKYGSSENFLDKYAQIKDAVIEFLKNSEKYEDFNSFKIPEVKNTVSTSNIYIDNNIGKRFVSIDLKHANFQTLRKFGVIPNMDWIGYVRKVAFEKGFSEKDEELIKYVGNSKYTRQVIFGQCNPKRTKALEKVNINQVREITDKMLANYKLVSINSDELIYEIPDVHCFDIDFAEQICEKVYGSIGLELRINTITFKGVKLKNEGGYTVASGYLKDMRGGSEFKCVPEPYMLMFIEWYNALKDSLEEDNELNDFDTFSLYSQYIVHDGIICKIDEKLHIEVIS